MKNILKLPRFVKRAIAGAADFVTAVMATLFAIYLSPVDSDISLPSQVNLYAGVVALGAFVVLVNKQLGLYHAVLRYMNGQLVHCASWSALIAAVSFSALMLFAYGQLSFAGVVAFALIIFVGEVVSRFWFLRLIGASSKKQGETVLVYGAGATGRQLVKGLHESLQFRCVGFIDDSPSLWGLTVEGVAVYRSNELPALVDRLGVKSVLLSMPSASFAERRRILVQLEPLKVEVRTVPCLQDIISGRASIEQLSDISIDDILGRDAVQPNPELLKHDIENEVVLVTGAGGSIGSEICRQVVRQKPKTLILYDVSEYALYTIHQELETMLRAEGVELHPIIGSVQNAERIHAVIERFNVGTIYHAAAYKHVPLVEHNMIEGVRNNVIGTLNVVKAASELAVKKFVLISTDKAVRPTNVMGASKRFAELIVQAYAAASTSCVFCMVRFGNVLGSSGSVVPKFKSQIQQGGPITLTHKDITRYFMTIPEASQLVIQAGGMAQGGEVFVLDMGDPVKIFDLAVRMVRYSGLEPSLDGPGSGDIDIMVTGLRKGEKLYEELLVGDNAEGTDHSKIMCAREVSLSLVDVLAEVKRFEKAVLTDDFEGLRSQLVRMPLEYRPDGDLCDELFVPEASLGAKVVDLLS